MLKITSIRGSRFWKIYLGNTEYIASHFKPLVLSRQEELLAHILAGERYQMKIWKSDVDLRKSDVDLSIFGRKVQTIRSQSSERVERTDLIL